MLALIADIPIYPLAVLVLITLASTAMLVWNVYRSAHQRRWLELKQWLRNHRMELAEEPPDPLPRLFPSAQWTRVITDGTRTLASGHDSAGRVHVLVLQTSASYAGAGLRPTAINASTRLLDATTLRAYPKLAGTERFITLGTTLHDARVLAGSPARGLLPPDLGLLVDGQRVIVDFSSRPFDPLEFSRLLPLVTQLSEHLSTTPAAGAAGSPT